MMSLKKEQAVFLAGFCALSVRASSLLNPVQDATVEMNLPDVNYGTAASLDAERDTTPSKGYVQFDASGLGPISNVTALKVVSLYQYGRTAEYYLIEGEDADQWDEDSITWNNAPGNDTNSAVGFLNNTTSSNLFIGRTVVVDQYTQTELVWDSDLAKAAILDALNGEDRKVTIGIRRNGDRRVQLASRENGIYSPIQLELQSETDYLPADTAISDEQFLGVLNEGYPGLERVVVAFGQGDVAGAKHLLCEYYRNRDTNFWWKAIYAIPGEEEGVTAFSSYQSVLDQTGYFLPEFWSEDEEYLWTDVEERTRRMYFFSSLGRAYQYTGNEDITKEWIDLFRAWIRQMPGEWNRLSTGIRLRSGWGDAFNSFMPSPYFDDENLFLFMKATYEQALYLRDNHSDTSNWLTFEMAGLYSAAVLFPEWDESEEWRAHVVDVVTHDLNRGWLPDGVTIELSPGYGTFFSNYLLISDLAGETGYEAGAVTNIVEKTEELYEPYLEMMAPGWETPAFNDNTAVDVAALFQSATNWFPARQDFLWAASAGGLGVEPDYQSAVFPYAGYMAIRSSWASNANYLCFDAGPVGYRHAHQDKLGVVMWAYGRQILTDNGPEYDGTVYENYFRDTYSHSTGLVDNRPQRRKWYQDPNPEVSYPYSVAEGFSYDVSNESVWVSGAYTNSYGLAGGSVSNDSYPYDDGSNFYDGWGAPANHYRQVVYLNSDIFVVQDWFVPNDSSNHTYEIRWQLDSLSIVTNGSRMETADAGLPNLAVVPLQVPGLSVVAVSAVNSPDIMGWKALNGATAATTVSHMRSGTGSRSFVTLLFPVKAGSTSEGIVYTESGGVITLETGDGRVFEITPAATPESRLQISTSPDSDQDSDGLPDWWEARYFDDPTSAAADALAANRKNTLREAYIAGLDPTDPAGRFVVVESWQGNQPVLSWDAISGRVYTVCWSTNLLEGFQEVVVPWSSGSYTGTLGGVQRFYKLKTQLEP